MRPALIDAICTLLRSRRSAIELPGGVNDNACHEKVDYSYFSALCICDGAGFLRERFRHNDAQRDYAASSASARSHRWNVTHREERKHIKSISGYFDS